MRLGFGEVSRETVRRQIKENPDAFVIERHGSDLTAKWHVTCPKYGFSMRFDHLAANADMTLLNLYRHLVHDGRWPISVDDETIYPVPIEETGANEGRGKIRRTVRKLPGHLVDVIRDRFDLSSDAEAVRMAVEELGKKIVK